MPAARIEMPAARICFLPQQVYLPLDSLAAAAIYPALPDTLSRQRDRTHC